MPQKTQHTPGPWHRNIRADGKYPVVFAGRNQHVAQACQQENPNETEANIDLIAAAPEMLEILQKLYWKSRDYLSLLKDNDTGESPEYIAQLAEYLKEANDVMKKAKGG